MNTCLFMWKWVTRTCLLTVPSVAGAGSRNDHLSRGFCSRSRRRHGTRGRAQRPVCLRYRASHCTRPGSPAWGTRPYWGPTELLNETERKCEENPCQAGNESMTLYLLAKFTSSLTIFLLRFTVNNQKAISGSLLQIPNSHFTFAHSV